MSISQLVKMAALEAMEASRPVNVFIGTVVSESPLSIKIDQKRTLTREFLVLCREVTDYDVEMTVDHMTEKMQGGGKDPSFTAHQHPYKGRKVFTVHKALKQGEKVVVVQFQGGQQYLVIDRIGG